MQARTSVAWERVSVTTIRSRHRNPGSDAGSCRIARGSDAGQTSVLRDLFFGSSAAVVAVGRQGCGLGDAGDDVAQDAHTGHAGNVADHVVQLEIHLDQSLLHAVDARRCSLHQLLSVPKIRTQRCDLRGGPEAAA